MNIRTISVFINITLLMVFYSCAPIRKFSSDNEKKSVENTSKQTIKIECAYELEQRKIYKFSKSASSYNIYVDHTCPIQNSKNSNIELSIPLNIIFVIDLTQSMESSFETIKQNIDKLTHNLKTANWNVKFAAVGFADTDIHFNFNTTEFLDSKKFIIELAKWDILNGNDIQEAGQAALEHALDMLLIENRKEKNKNQEKTENIVIYTSDAPAYFEDSQDLSISALARKINKKTEDGLNKTEIFYSVKDKLSASETIKGTATTIVLDQFKKLEEEAVNFTFKKMDFPISNKIIGEFTKENVKVSNTKTTQCIAHTAKLESINAIGIPSESKIEEAYNFTKNGKHLPFEVSKDPNTNNYKFYMHRCCSSEDPEQECQSFDLIELFFYFNQ